MLREEVCDDLTIIMLDTKRNVYTRNILRIMENITKEPALGFVGLGLSERKSNLGRRVRRIMSDNYRVSTKMTVLSVLILIIVGITGVFISCTHQPEVPLKESVSSSFIPPEIIIRQNEPLTKKKKELITKTLTDPGNKERFSKYFFISQAWGIQLRPPDDLKRAIINLTGEVNKYTNFNAKVDTHCYLDSRNMFESPFVCILADEAFKISDIERKNLGDYLRNGGFVFVDNETPEEEFSQAEESLRQMLRDALEADAKFIPIPNDHPLYHCFFDFDEGPPSGAYPVPSKVNYLEGIWLDGRIAVVYSDRGYGHRWKDMEKNKPQLKFGVNMVVYALLQEGGIFKKNIKTKP